MLKSRGRPFGALALSSAWPDECGVCLRGLGLGFSALPPPAAAGLRGDIWGGGPSLSTLRVRGERKPVAWGGDDCTTGARGLWARGLLRGEVGDGSWCLGCGEEGVDPLRLGECAASDDGRLFRNCAMDSCFFPSDAA